MTPDMQKKIARAAAALKAYGATEVYLFGSLAEGRFTRHSDIDMAVRGLPPEKFFHAMGETMEVLGRPFDLVDLDDGSALARHLTEKNLLVNTESIS